MKKIGIFLLILFVFIGIGFSYIQYKKADVEASVLKYLTTEKNISKSDIISSDPFIANLSRDNNWMVSVKLKDDDKTYYYYYKNNNEVILESNVVNGLEDLQ